MTIVNHSLDDIIKHGYNGPDINYMFIDEVQDFPPATLYLLSKMAKNGLFYSGDTAQAIVKGVNFKFSDIKGMFNKHFEGEILSIKKPAELHLTVNFRSHNKILQLANNIVSIIHTIFPHSIESLKKERSDLHGPVSSFLKKEKYSL
jgi:superfamily I DNA/RNA helicase